MGTVKIVFDDEIEALLILQGLPNSWMGIFTAISNSLGTEKLKFKETVESIFREDSRRKTATSQASTSDNALHVEER